MTERGARAKNLATPNIAAKEIEANAKVWKKIGNKRIRIIKRMGN